MYEQFQTAIEELKDKIIRKQKRANDVRQWSHEEAQLRTELLRQGQQAELLQEFMDDFMKFEEIRTLKRLSEGVAEAEDVQRDYQAAIRFYTYLRDIMAEAAIQRHKKGEL